VVDEVWFIGDASGEAENKIDENNGENEEIQYLEGKMGDILLI
jgi:hypothetical protein